MLKNCTILNVFLFNNLWTGLRLPSTVTNLVYPPPHYETEDFQTFLLLCIDIAPHIASKMDSQISDIQNKWNGMGGGDNSDQTS